MIKCEGYITSDFTLDDYGRNQSGVCVVTLKSLAHARRLQLFRRWLGKPMLVSDWYRTKDYNERMGYLADSAHLTGEATIISCNKLSDMEWKEYMNKWEEICKKDGVIGEIHRLDYGYELISNSHAKKFLAKDDRNRHK